MNSLQPTRLKLRNTRRLVHGQRGRTTAGGNRHGGLLLEAMIASISIGAATILAAMVLVSVNVNRRMAERMLIATQELDNQLEHLTARPWAELDAETVQQIPLSSAAAASLPNGQLQITVHEVQTPIAARRLDATLRWQDRGQGLRPPVRMSAWVFAPKETP